MQCLEVSGAVRPLYGSLGVKRLIKDSNIKKDWNLKNKYNIRNIYLLLRRTAGNIIKLIPAVSQLFNYRFLLFKYKKNIGCTLKLLNFSSSYASENVRSPRLHRLVTFIVLIPLQTLCTVWGTLASGGHRQSAGTEISSL